MLVKQLKWSKGDTPPTFDASGWSQNLIEGIKVKELGIYALPGTKFCINQKSEEANLIINGSGIFNMSFSDYPITGLYLNENDFEKNFDSHFIVIDLVYEKGAA